MVVAELEGASWSPVDLRRACRSGSFTRPTSGFCVDFVQANLVVIPEEFADEYEQFCRANPRPCPLLERLPTGSPYTSRLADRADVRVDLPFYHLYEQGRLVMEPPDLVDLWQPDFVTFLIGCSFTFEQALRGHGIPVRHLEEKSRDGGPKNVPMYRTNLECVPVGRFGGPMVVSMRPIADDRIEEATRLTAQYPTMHGEPIHVGDPKAIGIGDLNRPDWGDDVTIHPGETPVFWACGVTSQSALLQSRIPLAITHSPGCMFVSDRRHDEFQNGS